MNFVPITTAKAVLVLSSVTGFHKSAQSLSCHLEDNLEELTILPCIRIQKLHLTSCPGPLQVCADNYEISVFDQVSILVIST